MYFVLPTFAQGDILICIVVKRRGTEKNLEQAFNGNVILSPSFKLGFVQENDFKSLFSIIAELSKMLSSF